MALQAETVGTLPKAAHSPAGTEKLWQEFRKPHAAPVAPRLRARVMLTQPQGGMRQFVVETGSGHHLIVDDSQGGTGAKPIELVAAALAGCTAFDVITVLRNKRHQDVTGYEVRVEADQAERSPQVFTAVRIHHVVRGFDIDASAIEQAIRLSEEKYCSVGAMVQKTASFHTTFKIVTEKTDWLDPAEPAVTQA